MAWNTAAQRKYHTLKMVMAMILRVVESAIIKDPIQAPVEIGIRAARVVTINPVVLKAAVMAMADCHPSNTNTFSGWLMVWTWARPIWINIAWRHTGQVYSICRCPMLRL